MRESASAPEPTRVDWTLEIDVPAEAELSRVIRGWLDARPAEPRPAARAIYGGLAWLLRRSRPVTGRLGGDAEGLARLEVALPAAARQTLRLVASAVPSRWRWRSEGGALVGRAAREVRRVPCGTGGVLALAYALPDPGPLVLDGLPEVEGLRGGEVHLEDVRGRETELSWQLGFEDASAAAEALPAVEELLARIAREHRRLGLRYEGAYARDGASLSGRCRAIASPGWATVLDRIVDGAPDAAEVEGEGRLATSDRPG